MHQYIFLSFLNPIQLVPLLYGLSYYQAQLSSVLIAMQSVSSSIDIFFDSLHIFASGSLCWLKGLDIGTLCNSGRWLLFIFAMLNLFLSFIIF